MDTTERRRLDSERRAEYILDKAQAMVFSKGFEGTTMDDIAVAAGYTKRSIYLYYKDRDEVFFSLVLRGQRLLLEALRDALCDALRDAAKEGGSASSVRVLGSSFYRFSLAHPEFFELIMAYESKRHSYMRGRIDEDTKAAACQNISVEYGELLSEAIAREIETGRMSSGLDARQTMMLLWGQTFGVMQILLMRREGFAAVYGIEVADFFERFIEQVERGLSIDSPRALS